MKTDDLIDMLGTNVEPVADSKRHVALLAALGIGAAVAFCLIFVIFGAPGEAFGGGFLGLTVLTLAFTLGLTIAGARFLSMAARPGEAGRGALAAMALLLFSLILTAIVVLSLAGPSGWSAMIFGPQWAACLMCIPLAAVVPFLSLVWYLRNEAPTRLRLTGAVAGMVAGAIGATAFALHHPGGSLPFVALWFGGPLLLCALVGAVLGPRLLRW